MRRWTDFFILIVVLALTGACTSKTKPPTAPNAMEVQWNRIRDGINHLEVAHANRFEWERAADSVEPLESPEELASALQTINFSAVELDQAILEHSSSANTMLFGFECDHHAVVLFDSHGRSVRVIKW